MKIMKRWFSNLSLRGKLIVMFLITSFVPLIFVSSYSYSQTKKQILTQAKENMLNTNKQINANVQIRMESYEQIITLLFTDTTLKGYLTQHYNKDIKFVEAYEYINSLLYSILSANGDISEISIYVDNSSIPSDAFFIKHIYDAKNTPEWIHGIEMIQDTNLFLTTTTDLEGDNVLCLGKVLNYNSMNFPYGILVLSIKESILYSMIEKESSSKDIYITDNIGTIISAKDKSLISRNLEDVLGYSTYELKTGPMTRKINKQDCVVAYASLSSGIQTISVVPASELLGDTVSTSNRIMFLSIVSIIIALFLIMKVSRYFSNRFTLLNNKIIQIENEDFAVDDSNEDEIGNDEVGQLYAAFNRMSNRLNELINELYKKELLKKEAELQLLQSQINPHFLYNTLSAISSLAIHNDDKETAALSSHLSQFYKTTLNKGKRQISVKNELAITKHYIAIQHMRFENRFIERWEIGEHVDDYITLKLLMQPFVENAITHGIVDDSKPIHITLGCHLKEGKMIYEVEDDGAGMDSDTLKGILNPNQQTGYGIRNVRDRIKLAYGEKYDIDIVSHPGKGTKVTIMIPAILVAPSEM